MSVGGVVLTDTDTSTAKVLDESIDKPIADESLKGNGEDITEEDSELAVTTSDKTIVNGDKTLIANSIGTLNQIYKSSNSLISQLCTSHYIATYPPSYLTHLAGLIGFTEANSKLREERILDLYSCSERALNVVKDFFCSFYISLGYKALLLTESELDNQSLDFELLFNEQRFDLKKNILIINISRQYLSIKENTFWNRIKNLLNNQDVLIIFYSGQQSIAKDGIFLFDIPVMDVLLSEYIENSAELKKIKDAFNCLQGTGIFGNNEQERYRTVHDRLTRNYTEFIEALLTDSKEFNDVGIAEFKAKRKKAGFELLQSNKLPQAVFLSLMFLAIYLPSLDLDRFKKFLAIILEGKKVSLEKTEYLEGGRKRIVEYEMAALEYWHKDQDSIFRESGLIVHNIPFSHSVIELRNEVNRAQLRQILMEEHMFFISGAGEKLIAENLLYMDMQTDSMDMDVLYLLEELFRSHSRDKHVELVLYLLCGCADLNYLETLANGLDQALKHSKNRKRIKALFYNLMVNVNDRLIDDLAEVLLRHKLHTQCLNLIILLAQKINDKDGLIDRWNWFKRLLNQGGTIVEIRIYHYIMNCAMNQTDGMLKIHTVLKSWLPSVQSNKALSNSQRFALTFNFLFAQNLLTNGALKDQDWSVETILPFVFDEDIEWDKKQHKNEKLSLASYLSQFDHPYAALALTKSNLAGLIFYQLVLNNFALKLVAENEEYPINLQYIVDATEYQLDWSSCKPAMHLFFIKILIYSDWLYLLNNHNEKNTNNIEDMLMDSLVQHAKQTENVAPAKAIRGLYDNWAKLLKFQESLLPLFNEYKMKKAFNAKTYFNKKLRSTFYRSRVKRERHDDK